MSATDVPTRQELVRRSAELAPLLRENSLWSEENRRVHEDCVEALAAAGIFKMRVPKRYGGYECDTRTLIDVAVELAKGDGSTSWTASVFWIPTWMTCLFPDQSQDEVFATDNVRVCGTLSPSALATPVDGGVRVNGRWNFISGAWHSQWQEIVAIQIGPGGQGMPIIALVPVTELEVVDDWYTAGLRGTGSVTTVARELFVPQERILPLPAILQGQGASELNAASSIYRAPLLPVASASSVGTALGLAKAARDAFFQRLPERKITYTRYAAQRDAPLTHLQVAEASLKLDEAEFHAYRLADLVDGKAAQGAEWTVEERARARADMGAACRLAKEAVEIFQTASGASSIYRDIAIQRISRDIQALNLHALMHPNTNNELYGRVLCGLEPNTDYI